MIQKIKRPVVLWLAALLVLGGVVAFQTKNDRLFAIAKSIDIFASLIRELDTYYVDQIDPEQLLTVGIQAMLEELDPYTEFIPEEESDDFRMLTTGEYAGVGALIGNRGEGNIVLMPYTGFPAQNAGIRIGDLLLKVDSVAVQKKSTSEVSELLAPAGLDYVGGLPVFTNFWDLCVKLEFHELFQTSTTHWAGEGGRSTSKDASFKKVDIKRMHYIRLIRQRIRRR